MRVFDSAYSPSISTTDAEIQRVLVSFERNARNKRGAPTRAMRPPKAMRIKRRAPKRAMRPPNAMRIRCEESAARQRGLCGHRTRTRGPRPSGLSAPRLQASSTEPASPNPHANRRPLLRHTSKPPGSLVGRRAWGSKLQLEIALPCDKLDGSAGRWLLRLHFNRKVLAKIL